jgi:endonuclease/exonuclease/phosphatase family metal-dependent hydrolase
VLRGPRFILSAIALVSLCIELPHQLGMNRLDPVDPAKPSLRLVQWNVMWGGDWSKGARWASTVERIREQTPDVVVLSEAPWDEDKIDSLRASLGEEWKHVVRFDYNSTRIAYWSRMRVVSRYPVTKEYSRSNSVGTLAIVRVDAPTPMRLMLVDGLSGPNNKAPLLDMIAGTLKSDARVDVVCGDFNAISRSHGFEALRAMQYRDAANRDWSWRGTWPSAFPIYDIDHVLIAPSLAVGATHTFSNDCTDHRGRVVDLQRR